MALYAIGDLHLSFGADKPMDVFGGRWDGYIDKLRAGLSCITEEDTTVLLGDLSWAMSMEAAQPDFAFISAIPGRKIVLKGNHDYWWTTAAKFHRFCAEQGFSQMFIKKSMKKQKGRAACTVTLPVFAMARFLWRMRCRKVD